MNLLAKEEVFAENKLFATVDSTVRKVVINQIPFLLTDTVGFIRKLPTTLIECFKSTLDEIVEADILLHVVDISHPAFEEQIEVVNKTLLEIGAINKKVIMVFNKVDALKEKLYQEDLQNQTEQADISLDEIKRYYQDKFNNQALFISATKKENIQLLKEVLFEAVREKYLQIYPNYLVSENHRN
jgi:GTP-binding protein HflX